MAVADRLGARDDLAALRQAGDARRLVDALAAEVVADLLRVRGVQPDPHRRREAAFWRCSARRRWIAIAAAMACSGRVEADEEPVAGRRDLAALVGS